MSETFAIMDYNKDGEITVEEAIAALKILSPNETEDNIRTAFKSLVSASPSGTHKV